MGVHDECINVDSFLSFAGKLAEEAVHVDGMGKVLVRELSGEGRAKVLEVLAPAAQEGGRADIGSYQRMLLELGLIDPASPEDDRRPLLDIAGAMKAMKLGASKVEVLCAAVERLSGLDKTAAQRAEGNSKPTPSSTSTSG